jgi:hypothetical protein
MLENRIMSRKQTIYPSLLNQADELLTNNRSAYEASPGYSPEEGAVIDAMALLGIINILEHLKLRDMLIEGLEIRQARKAHEATIDPKE